MRNQPKYAFFKNTRYALEGFLEVLKNETSFKIEMTIFLAVWALLPFLALPLWAKAVLGLSLLLVVIAELANSAVERVVDLVTKEYHPLAKQAKDAGAAMVMASIVLTVGIWLVTLYYLWA
ncbi:MAG: diacylglycerol kinase [Epsilonproteobacteria bacterium]|jgi:diacylglycerol kinase (ATP)|nr:diacylglycerol kinase [Campylobacterota bacterium]